MLVIGVSKRYSNSKGQNRRRPIHGHRPSTKKRWYVYYLDDPRGVIHAKRISYFEVPIYRAQIRRTLRRLCGSCGLSIRTIEGFESIECPGCGLEP